MTIAKKTIAAVAGVVALGAGLGIAGIANADPTPTPTTTSSPTGAPSGAPDPRHGPGRDGHGPREDALAAKLADKLGIDQAKVTDALKAVRDETRPTTRPTPGADRPAPGDRDAALAKALAGKLNIDEAKIKTALDKIRSAEATDRAAALKTRLDDAVKAGTLTQAEADAVTKAVEKDVINVGPR
jgi:hypothetical protein